MRYVLTLAAMSKEDFRLLVDGLEPEPDCRRPGRSARTQNLAGRPLR